MHLFLCLVHELIGIPDVIGDSLVIRGTAQDISGTYGKGERPFTLIIIKIYLRQNGSSELIGIILAPDASDDEELVTAEPYGDTAAFNLGTDRIGREPDSGITVDMTWKNGRVTSLTLTSDQAYDKITLIMNGEQKDIKLRKVKNLFIHNA